MYFVKSYSTNVKFREINQNPVKNLLYLVAIEMLIIDLTVTIILFKTMTQKSLKI